jgi:spermidine synthase
VGRARTRESTERAVVAARQSGQPELQCTTMVVVSAPSGSGREPAGGPTGDHGRIELLRDLDRPRAWMLMVGGTPQSYVDLDDPLNLEFEYVRRLGHVVDLAAPAGQPLRVPHLGAGALSLARYVAATRPGSSQLAVESDADLVALVRRRLPISQPARRTAGTQRRIRIRVADAREILEQLPQASFDVVIADVFAGARTPAHLTSVEFDQAVHSALAPAGTYAVNVGDGPPLAHVRARLAAICSVFPAACLIGEAAVLRGRRFGNLVLVASKQELPTEALARRVAADPFPARLVRDAAVGRFLAGARPITDATAEASPAPPANVFALGPKSHRTAH